MWIKFRRLVQNDIPTAVIWWIKTGSRIPVWRTFLGEFGHVIPEPRATLQVAATWRIQCHIIPQPRAILQGAATWRIQCHFISEPRAALQGAATMRPS